jgi:hypothetical protein
MVTHGRFADLQVTVVRKDREMERMQRSLREFIDDVAPVQLQAAVYDAATVRATIARGQNGGSDTSDGILGAVGAISQQYKSLKVGRKGATQRDSCKRHRIATNFVE